MEEKIVYAFDPGTRLYVGPVALDDSDLSPAELEAGERVYHIPGNCLELEPPPFDAATHLCREAGGAWVVKPIPELEPEPELSLDRRKARLTAKATEKRWKIETGGLALPGGIEILTERADQDRITSVLVHAQRAGMTSIDFKAASGWTTLTVAEVEGIANAVALHVQACFSAERAHHEAIAALQTVQAATEYDLAAGWPA